MTELNWRNAFPVHFEPEVCDAKWTDCTTTHPNCGSRCCSVTLETGEMNQKQGQRSISKAQSAELQAPFLGYLRHNIFLVVHKIS